MRRIICGLLLAVVTVLAVTDDADAFGRRRGRGRLFGGRSGGCCGSAVGQAQGGCAGGVCR